jgi:hypothetical protein
MLSNLAEDIPMLQRTVLRFAHSDVAPVAEHLARTKSFPYEPLRQMGNLG